jgi:hypothetical protein
MLSSGLQHPTGGELMEFERGAGSTIRFRKEKEKTHE